jgi:hypothetical protein
MINQSDFQIEFSKKNHFCDIFEEIKKNKNQFPIFD